MKTTIFGVAELILLVLTIVIVASICNTQNRDVNIKDNVRETLETSLDITLEQKSYSISNISEFITDLSTTMSSYLPDNTELVLDVQSLDNVEGLVSVKATVNYTLESTDKSSSIPSSITCTKTVFLDKEDPLYYENIKQGKTFTLTYQLPNVLGEPITYKIYTLVNEEAIKIPPVPVMELNSFQGWKDVNTGILYSEATLKALPLSKSYQFIAVFVPL